MSAREFRAAIERIPESERARERLCALPEVARASGWALGAIGSTTPLSTSTEFLCWEEVAVDTLMPLELGINSGVKREALGHSSRVVERAKINV